MGAILLSASTGFAQTTAGPAYADGDFRSVTATPIKILPPFAALGQGTGADSFAACPDVACGSVSCVREQANGNIKGQLIGTGSATFSFEISLNTTTSVVAGSFGNNYPAQGIGTITQPNGKDKINLLIQGTAADAIGGFNTAFSGAYLVNGGAGKFASAAGAGAFTFNQNFANSGNGPTTLIMNGTLLP
jgi:hypothetical protein